MTQPAIDDLAAKMGADSYDVFMANLQASELDDKGKPLAAGETNLFYSVDVTDSAGKQTSTCRGAMLSREASDSGFLLRAPGGRIRHDPAPFQGTTLQCVRPQS